MNAQPKHQFTDGSILLIRSIAALEELHLSLVKAPNMDDQRKQVEGQLLMAKNALKHDIDYRMTSLDLEAIAVEITQSQEPDQYIQELVHAKGNIHGIYAVNAVKRIEALLGENATPEVKSILAGLSSRALLSSIAMIDTVRTFNILAGSVSSRTHDVLIEPIQQLIKVNFGHMPELDAATTYSPDDGWIYGQEIPLLDADSTEVKLYEVVTLNKLIDYIAVANGTWIEKTTGEDGKMAIGIEMNHEVPLYVSNNLRGISASTISCWREAKDEDINAKKYAKCFEFQKARMQEFATYLSKAGSEEQVLEKEPSGLILPDHMLRS